MPIRGTMRDPRCPEECPEVPPCLSTQLLLVLPLGPLSCQGFKQPESCLLVPPVHCSLVTVPHVSLCGWHAGSGGGDVCMRAEGPQRTPQRHRGVQDAGGLPRLCARYTLRDQSKSPSRPAGCFCMAPGSAAGWFIRHSALNPFADPDILTVFVGALCERSRRAVSLRRRP